jgi:hypothetical protein
MTNRDATGNQPGDFKVEGNTVYVAFVMPVKVGPDEYETQLRWHIAPARELKRYNRIKEAGKV